MKLKPKLLNDIRYLPIGRQVGVAIPVSIALLLGGKDARNGAIKKLPCNKK
jgi:hypothetical protein